MAYTEKQWNDFQKLLPAEDRVSYIEYLRVSDPAAYNQLSGGALARLKEDSLEPKTTTSVSAAEGAAQTRAKTAAEKAAAEKTAVELKAKQQADDKWSTEIVADGLTQAQLDALAGQQSAKEAQTYAAEIAALADRFKKGEKLTAEQLASLGLTPQGTVKIVTPGEPPIVTPGEPPNKPGAAWIVSPDGKGWIKPPQTNPTDTWDDTKGWVPKAGPSTDTSGGPGKRPGAGWVLSVDGKTWIKPNMPTQVGKAFSWDDEQGWIGFNVGNKTIKSTTYTGTGKNRKRVVTYTDGTSETFDDPEVAGARTIISTSYRGVGANRKRVVTYSDNTTETFDDPEILTPPVDTSSTTKTDSTTTTANTSVTGVQYNDRLSIYSALADRFAKYGLTSLANKIKELAMQGATEATITLQLQETPEYQQRFAANADRIKKGLAALTPAEYVNIEDSYRQVLRAYGLKQFDNDAYVKQFIANDMSPTELSNRVVTAVQRVQNADPALISQLKQYYGIGATDMVAYVLDPEQQFQKIERQIAASEIGVAAGRQGLKAGVSVAEQLAAQGVTEAEARKGYSTIADILPTAEKLSDIYGTTLDEYRQAEGEQEVFNSLASAQRKRQRLTARELAAFGGSSGTNKTSLTTSSVGQF